MNDCTCQRANCSIRPKSLCEEVEGEIYHSCLIRSMCDPTLKFQMSHTSSWKQTFGVAWPNSTTYTVCQGCLMSWNEELAINRQCGGGYRVSSIQSQRRQSQLTNGWASRSYLSDYNGLVFSGMVGSCVSSLKWQVQTKTWPQKACLCLDLPTRDRQIRAAFRFGHTLANKDNRGICGLTLSNGISTLSRFTFKRMWIHWCSDISWNASFYPRHRVGNWNTRTYFGDERPWGRQHSVLLFWGKMEMDKENFQGMSLCPRSVGTKLGNLLADKSPYVREWVWVHFFFYQDHLRTIVQ